MELARELDLVAISVLEAVHLEKIDAVDAVDLVSSLFGVVIATLLEKEGWDPAIEYAKEAAEHFINREKRDEKDWQNENLN